MTDWSDCMTRIPPGALLRASVALGALSLALPLGPERGEAATVSYAFAGTLGTGASDGPPIDPVREFEAGDRFAGSVTLDTAAPFGPYPFQDTSLDRQSTTAVRDWSVAFSNGDAFSGRSGTVSLGNDLSLGDRLVLTMRGAPDEPLTYGRDLTFFQLDLVDRDTPDDPSDLLGSSAIPPVIELDRLALGAPALGDVARGRLVLRNPGDDPTTFADDAQIPIRLARLSVEAPPLSGAGCVEAPGGFLCEGFDPDGVRDTRPSVLGEVAAGARVEGMRAVAVGDGATVINEGRVAGDGVGLAGGDDLTAVNEGTITAGAMAVRAGDRLTLRNASGSLIEGGEIGIDTGEQAQISNAGTIRGGGAGIRGQDFVTVRNAQSGTISGGIGSSFNVTLDNAGLVEGGVFADYDTKILNRATGVIRGGIVGGPSLNDIVNHGLIDGDIYGSQGLGVTNTGTLLGGIGATDEGIGIVNSGLIRTEGSAAVGMRGAEPYVTNTGRIVVGEDAAQSEYAAWLDNSGSVVAGDDGVDADYDAFLTNSGTVRAADDGVVSGFVAYVTNTGRIVAGAEGVEAAGRAEVRQGRGGVIRGGTTGLRVGEGSTVENEGLIRGVSDAAIHAGSGLTLDSQGPIQGGSDGVVIEGDGRVALYEGGSVRAPGVAIRASGAVDVSLGIGGAVTGGTAGVVGGDGSSLGTMEYESYVTARGDAVRFGRDAAIFGDGFIQSTGSGDAVSVVDGRITVVDSEGAIMARRGAAIRVRAGDPGTGPEGSLAVRVEGGTVAGAVGVKVDPRNLASQSITNLAGGSISGRSGVAIDLGAGDDVVTSIDASIEGDVLLGVGNDRLEIGSGSSIVGDTLFGSGDDRLVYDRSMFAEVVDAFGLFDGGAGFDTARFDGFGLASLRSRAVEGGFRFLFADGGTRLSATLTNFESVRLDDATLMLDDAMSPAPVPLPAAWPLLMAALGGLALIRRR